jgi:hypothetical protein
MSQTGAFRSKFAVTFRLYKKKQNELRTRFRERRRCRLRYDEHPFGYHADEHRRRIPNRESRWSMSETFDAIIIGAGQAGPPLAGRLTATGLKVAVIERKLFGGTCVNTGCIPTKTLIASARAARVARRAGDYGVTLGASVGVNMARVKARKDQITGTSRNNIERWLAEMKGCTVFRSHGVLKPRIRCVLETSF